MRREEEEEVETKNRTTVQMHEQENKKSIYIYRVGTGICTNNPFVIPFLTERRMREKGELDKYSYWCFLWYILEYIIHRTFQDQEGPKKLQL